MGQYYSVAVKIGNEKPFVNDRRVKGQGYIMAKLMEHSWLSNPLCICVAKLLDGKKARVAWVGDYAEDDEIVKLTGGELNYDKVWNEESSHEFDEPGEFSWNGLALVNFSKKKYVDMDDYIEQSDEGGWCVCPIPLLTAVGNDRGGGDYHEGGKCYDLVGTWAWDEIGLVKKDEVPDGFEPLDLSFSDR